MDLTKVVYDKRIIKGRNRTDILDDNTLNCTVGIDGNFVMGMGVLLISILKHNPHRPLNFHIFTDKSIDMELLNFQQVVEDYPNLIIIIHYLDEQAFAKLPSEFIWTTAIYYRFLVPIELSKMGITKAWYLDSDELCVGEICDFPITKGHSLAATASIPEGARKKALVKITGREDIINMASAGIYIDIPTWMEQKISENAIYALEHDDLFNYKFFDGDALIKAVNNRLDNMEERYNYCYNLVIHKHDLPKDTVFVHFAGTAKPWKIWAQDNPQTRLWLKYKNDSPWKDYPLDLPKNYRQAKFMVRYMKRIGDKKGAIRWWLTYAWYKITGKNEI